MKKNLYENKNPKLRELKQARDASLLAKEIQRMSRQINQRFYRLEKKGLASDTAYRYAQKETDKEKPRYSTNLEKLESLPIQELYEIGIQINAKLVSKSSTITGLKYLTEKRLTSSLESLFEGENISKEDWNTFLNNGGGELMNNKWLSSYQVAEDWNDFVRSGGVSAKEFVVLYNEQIAKYGEPFDAGAMRRRLKNLAKKGK